MGGWNHLEEGLRGLINWRVLLIFHSTLFSAFSLTHSIEIGTNSLVLLHVMNVLKRKRENVKTRNYHKLHFILQHFARSTEIWHCFFCLICFYMWDTRLLRILLALYFLFLFSTIENHLILCVREMTENVVMTPLNPVRCWCSSFL